MKFPTDIVEANEAWQANCGPCALAAVLGKQVNDLRPVLEPFKGWMTPTDMQTALTKLGKRFHVGPSAWPDKLEIAFESRLVKEGLLFVQWGGHEKRPARAQYRYTHWIGVNGLQVFEVNAPGLMNRISWEGTMPFIMKDEGQGNGEYFIRTAIWLDS